MVCHAPWARPVLDSITGTPPDPRPYDCNTDWRRRPIGRRRKQSEFIAEYCLGGGPSTAWKIGFGKPKDAFGTFSDSLPKELVIDFRPDGVDVLHGLQLPVAQPALVGHFLRSPQEPVEPLMVMMKPLVCVLFGLGREQEKRPITPLQKDRAPGRAAGESAGCGHPPFGPPQ